MLSHTWWIFESVCDQNSGTLQPCVIITWLIAAFVCVVSSSLIIATFICVNMFVYFYLYWVCVRLYPWREINPDSNPDFCLNLKQIWLLALKSTI